MNTTGFYLLLILVSAIIGWLLSRLFIHLLFTYLQKKQSAISLQISKAVVKEFSLDAIEQKLTNPVTVKNIIPVAEVHVDDFLRNKLPVAMPMIGMFISDRLVSDLKAIFMNELEELFPVIIQQYITSVKKDMDAATMIQSKLAAVSLQQVRFHLKKELRFVKMFGITTGIVIAFVQILLTRIA